jgi:NADPH:quinone reductase-like Zn-dependent oxidoreductase
MRAVGLTEFGGPEALKVLELDEPHAGHGEVRIRVRAASVAPADGLFRSGALAARLTSPAPWVPGTEVAGVVDEAPEGSPWAVGDEVIAIVVPFHQRPGAYAEHVVVPDGSVGPRPQSYDFATAAALPMSGLTASALVELLRLERGESVAVTGAGGVVGSLVVQLARRAGATVLADAAGGDEELVRGGDYAQQIRRLHPDGVDVLVDAALIGASLLPAVRDGGRAAALRAGLLESERDISIVSVSVWDYAEDGARLRALSSLLDEGELVPPEVRAFSMEDAAAAHEALGRRGQRARSVLVF